MLKDTEVLYGKGKSALFWSASLANIVSADQVSAETATELVTNQWEIAEQANEVAQSKTDILADMQAEVENTELTISEDDTQTVVTETDMDITLSDFNELGFLLLDESKEGDDAKIQPDNYSFKDLANHTQIFLKDEDKTIYTNPYFVSTIRLISVQQTSPTEIVAIVSNLADADKDELFENVKVTDKDGNLMTISDLVLNPETNQSTIIGDFSQLLAPYTVSYAGDDYQAKTNWQYTDSLYAYDGELGARVSEEGVRVDLTVWSPSADSVSVVLYDKDDQTKVVGKIAMVKGDKGQWSAALTQESGLGVSDYRGYYYHYEITRGDETVLALDPYAKSLAEWNSDLIGTDPSYKVAKAAIVDTSTIGNQELTYADISGYTDREDAIIYEAHVRDFTSDIAISDELQHQFGTFAAFVEKIDYLQELDVTHIQLLPVMSYYYVNELANAERLTDYASSNTNYNWGYDPQSYFALTGMYSEDPTNPAKRIEEFKNLIAEIHKRGMGVILALVNSPKDTITLQNSETISYQWVAKEKLKAFLETHPVVPRHRLLIETLFLDD